MKCDTQHNDTVHYGGVVMLSVIYTQYHLCSVENEPIMLIVVMLNIVMPGVIRLSVLAPQHTNQLKYFCSC
jgi:hypothetical protein